MPEIVAAHLERVAKETAKLCAEDVNTINFNRGHVLHNIRGEYDHVMPTEEMAKVIEWRVAAALAACAREAKLEVLHRLPAHAWPDKTTYPQKWGVELRNALQGELLKAMDAVALERAVGESK